MALQPGARFGRYELVSRLGRGGMAETYRARLVGEAGVTKPVLIKKVLPEYANDDAFTTMFVSEARISASLSHGNIAQVYDFGRVDGEYFLAMEFVDGQPLNRILKRALRTGMSGLPIPVAVFIAIEMCRGLHYAHTRTDDSGKLLGIVHRDISPDNVLISYEGQVKIVDFGIAKARELRGFNTEPGVVKGKYLYFSPEQAKGKEVDARTDVWATGVVLYEMFCGQLPVRGPSYTVMPLLVQGKFPRPREINPELPKELDDIVMQALAVDLDARLESCHELGDALAGFLYSAEPRFSAMSLSHFMHQLFGEELQSEGRQVQVPRSFLEQMERWSLATVPTNPVRKAASTPTPPETPAVVTREPRTRDVRSEVVTRQPQPKSFRDDYVQEGVGEEELAEPSTPSSTSKLLYVGGGIGVAVLALLIGMAVMGEPEGAHDPSALKPMAPRRETIFPPDRTAPPAVAKASTDSMPAQETPKPVQEAASGTSSGAPAQAERSREQARIAERDALKLLSVRMYREALEMATRCIELDEGSANCYLLAAEAHFELKEFSPAAEKYRSFLRLAPEDPRAVMANIRLRSATEEASKQDKAGEGSMGAKAVPADVASKPKISQDEEAAAARADATKLIKVKQYPEARNRASRCLELKPNDAECLLLKGLSYAHENEWGTASPFLKRFLELAPDHKLAPKIRASLKMLEEQDKPSGF